MIVESSFYTTPPGVSKQVFTHHRYHIGLSLHGVCPSVYIVDQFTILSSFVHSVSVSTFTRHIVAPKKELGKYTGWVGSVLTRTLLSVDLEKRDFSKTLLQNLQLS